MADIEIRNRGYTKDIDPAEIAAHLLSGAAAGNPYPLYMQLREMAPVHRVADGRWIASRYDDVAALLRDPRVSSDPATSLQSGETRQPAQISEIAKRAANWMSFSDPPRHTRLRSLVHKAFTPRAVEALREYIRATVDARLDVLVERGELDFLPEVAHPLPTDVICEVLGVPAADRDLFGSWGAEIMAGIDALATNPAHAVNSDTATRSFSEYIRELIDARRRTPRDDFLTALINADEAGGRLSNDELVGTVLLLLVAGHETTVHLSCNGLVALMRDRAQWELLRETPDLAATAVEELLRFAGPLQFISRFAREEIELGGQRIAPGERVLVMLASANRDPEQFHAADRLDITRAPNRHVALGGGIHYCIGASLARLEVDLLLRGLVARVPTLELATDELAWRPTAINRATEALPVRVPAPAA